MEIAPESRPLLGDRAGPVERLELLLRLDVEDLEELHREHAEQEAGEAAHDLEREPGDVEPAARVADAPRADGPRGHDQPAHDPVDRQHGRRGRRVGLDAGHARVAQLGALAPEADRRQDRAGEEQAVARQRYGRVLPFGGAPPRAGCSEGRGAEDPERDGDREPGQRAADDRRHDDQAQAELDQEEERGHLHQRAQHDEALDDALAEVGLLDRDEDVAPHRQGLDEGEGSQPDQRRRQRQPGRAAALEPHGEAQREEHEPLREQDDGLVLDEELARGLTAP